MQLARDFNPFSAITLKICSILAFDEIDYPFLAQVKLELFHGKYLQMISFTVTEYTATKFPLYCKILTNF